MHQTIHTTNHFNFTIFHFPKKNRSYPAYALPLHLGLGQFEHSVTRRPVPSVQLLSSTSLSLTRLPHWHVFVFGAGAAAAGVCSWGWGSSRCLLWPMVVERGACIVVIVVALVLSCGNCLITNTPQTISISRFHCGGKKYTVATLSQGIILKRILFRGEYAPDNLFTRTVAPKQGLIHLKKIGLTLPFSLTFSLFSLRLRLHHDCTYTRRSTSIRCRRGCLPRSRQTRQGSRSVFRHRR